MRRNEWKCAEMSRKRGKTRKNAENTEKRGKTRKNAEMRGNEWKNAWEWVKSQEKRGNAWKCVGD